jgi:hypothetical protein
MCKVIAPLEKFFFFLDITKLVLDGCPLQVVGEIMPSLINARE